jgi:hypothetical protein
MGMNGAAWFLGALSCASLATMLAGKPWTLAAAKRKTPPEVWSTGLFLETNMIITGAWAVLFALGAFSAASMPWWVNLLLGVFYPVLGGLSSRFGSWYSSWRLRRMGIGPR